MDLKAFGSAITQIAEEKGISEDQIIETIELALAAAYKRDYASRGEHICIKLDTESGKMVVNKVYLVVDENMLKPELLEEEEVKPKQPETVRAAARAAIQEAKGEAGEGDAEEDDRIRFNPERHMMVEDAKKIEKGVKPGEELLIELEPHEEFGRIAAQTAKQVIVQRLREVERETIASEYEERSGEIISGLVQRVEGRTIHIDLGRGVGVLFPQDQIPGEFLRLGARIRVLLLEVNPTPRGPQIILSRANPEFVKQLFDMEVPEIASGVVEIQEIAREAGSRTKIAVSSNQAGVDPIGACVGQRGTRVLTVINELNGEKIDVIEFSDDAERFIANSLAPAAVTRVELSDRMQAKVTVPDDQMSLAIGREGQNVRLAVKLTKWKIEIEGAEEFEEMMTTEETGDKDEEDETSEETGKDAGETGKDVGDASSDEESTQETSEGGEQSEEVKKATAADEADAGEQDKDAKKAAEEAATASGEEEA